MFYLCRAAVAHLKPGSAIINTSSINATSPSPHLLAYATTKGAIANFTAGLGQLLAKKGIRVNAVAPGPIWTPLFPRPCRPRRSRRSRRTMSPWSLEDVTPRRMEVQLLHYRHPESIPYSHIRDLNKIGLNHASALRRGRYRGLGAQDARNRL